MSVLNVWLSPDRAIVAVDTAGQCLNTGKQLEFSKLALLPHAGLILAHRGSTFGFSMVVSIAMTSGLHDFDSGCSAMPQMLKQAFAIISASSGALCPSDPSAVSRLQLVLVGWSASAQRMRALMFQQQTVELGFEQCEFEDLGYVIPWQEDWGDPGESSDAGAMHGLMLQQVANARRVCPPGSAFGGSMVMAEISRTGIIVGTRELQPSSAGAAAARLAHPVG